MALNPKKQDLTQVWKDNISRAWLHERQYPQGTQ